MILPSPVSVQPPSFTRKNGEVRTFNPFTVAELDITITDNPKRKLCTVQIARFRRPITLWEGSAYDVAGDYTQAQVEARILEVLGPNIKAGLEALFQ